MDFSYIFTFNFVTIMLSFMFVDLFDTLGTLIGVASKANMLDKQGRLPRIRGALLADSVATSAGAVLGTSTVTTFVESSSGVMAGGYGWRPHRPYCCYRGNTLFGFFAVCTGISGNTCVCNGAGAYYCRLFNAGYRFEH